MYYANAKESNCRRITTLIVTALAKVLSFSEETAEETAIKLSKSNNNNNISIKQGL